MAEQPWEPLMYAEHLPHLNTINVHAILPSNSSSGASAAISDDGLQFILRHDGKETVLDLPVSAISQEPRKQAIPSASPNEVGFRLHAEKRHSILRAAQDFEPLTPWSAQALKQLECIHCSNCRCNIVKPFTIQTWKNLPSENWAEMMEHWYCHRPRVFNPDHPTAAQRHPASIRISAQAATGLVDSYTFLFRSQDLVSVKQNIHIVCCGQKEGDSSPVSLFENHSMAYSPIHLPHIKTFIWTGETWIWRNLGFTSAAVTSKSILSLVHKTPLLFHRMVSLALRYGSQRDTLKVENASQNASSSLNLVCTSCAQTLGFVDDKYSGWRLLKSSVSAGIHPYSVILQHFPLEKWIAAFLLAAVEGQTSKRFTLHDPDKQEVLLLWLFTPDLRISYTSSNGSSIAIRVIKLFWKTRPRDAGSETVPIDQSLGHVDLPMPQYYHALKSHLEQNESILPVSARTFQDWKVGILRRFDMQDTSGHD